MPELPEVELVRRSMLELVSLTICQVKVHDSGILERVAPKQLKNSLIGRSIEAIDRRGKQLMVVLDDGKALAMHLGMTGNIMVTEEDREDRHLRLTIRFCNGVRLHFIDQRKFGSVGLFDNLDELLLAKGLGPDALSISSTDFIERVGGRHRAIKTVLLDQGVLAGVGNLYSDEMLYQCKVHPQTRSEDLGRRQMQCLHKAMVDILQRSLAVGSDFDMLPSAYLLHSRVRGERCPRCSSAWETLSVNGRTAFFCPKCQRLILPSRS